MLKSINNNENKATFKIALKACVPVIFGYLPTGFAFGLMLTATGYSFITAIIMSIVIYAGAGQYLAVDFFANNLAIIQMAILTFLINTKHLFYGLSLLDDYNAKGIKKFYLMFSLTDETYALLTSPNSTEDIDRTKYCLYVSIINQSAWVISTLLGAVLGTLIKFDITGMEFAMTALFIVILIDQLKTYRTKIPFILGTACALAAFFIVGKQNMLLLGSTFTVILMLIFRSKIEKEDKKDDAN